MEGGDRFPEACGPANLLAISETLQRNPMSHRLEARTHTPLKVVLKTPDTIYVHTTTHTQFIQKQMDNR